MKNSFPVVCIGGSAGGLEAYIRLQYKLWLLHLIGLFSYK